MVEMHRNWAIGALIAMCCVLLGITIFAGNGASASGNPTPTRVPLVEPEFGSFDMASVAEIDLAAYSPVPEIGEQAQIIYREGLLQGANPNAFIKVGDCMTDNPFFLIPIGEGDYALGTYDNLQPVVDQFTTGEMDSFSRKSQAAAGGFTIASILDSMWANPEFCEADQTPLACEIAIMRPSIALIMFGTNDVYYLDEAQFDFFLRSIIVETIRSGVLPVVSTFPVRPEFPDKSELFNKIVVKAALDYEVPLINLWLALADLPNQGVDPVETTHLSAPENGQVCHFIDANMQAGFTVRNLLTLQTLDAVLQAVAEE